MKKSLKATLLARAVDVTEEQDRARFAQLLVRIQDNVDKLEGPEDLHRCGVGLSFSELVHLAKSKLGISRDEFLKIVEPFNTEHSRVLDTCPAEKDTRTNVPDEFRMPDEEFRMKFDLVTPERVADLVANYGAQWGYGPVKVARARKEYSKYRAAYREKQDAEDCARAVARSAEIEANQHAFYLRIQEMKAEALKNGVVKPSDEVTECDMRAPFTPVPHYFPDDRESGLKSLRAPEDPRAVIDIERKHANRIEELTGIPYNAEGLPKEQMRADLLEAYYAAYPEDRDEPLQRSLLWGYGE